MIRPPKEFEDYLWTLETSYGYAYSSGWVGIGACYYEEDYTVVWFMPTLSCCNEDEILFCELMQMNILEDMGILYESKSKEDI